MNALIDSTRTLLGLGVDAQQLTFGQITLRGVVVFTVALIAVRVGDKRFLSKETAFDAILGFILASMFARAVNGSAAFFPTLGGGFVLILLHRAVAYIARDHHWFGNLVKGHADEVISDGSLIMPALRKNDISEHDLMENIRLNGNLEEIKKVKAAYIERNGQISIVT